MTVAFLAIAVLLFTDFTYVLLRARREGEECGCTSSPFPLDRDDECRS